MTASDFCAARYIFFCHAGGHPHMRRRQFVTLLGGLHGLKTDSSACADD
jgi:hypothetical protein